MSYGLSPKTKLRKSDNLQYGTSRDYTIARLRGYGLRLQEADPDNIFLRLREKLINGEISAAEARRQAGWDPNPPDEEKALERLCNAWEKADPDSRASFLWLIEDLDDPTGSLLDKPPRQGMSPYPSEAIPELEALIAKGKSVSQIARELGTTYRTLARWRSGKSIPSAAMLEKIRLRR